VISPAGRAILAELRRELGLAAERMEAEVLQPFRDDEEKLTRYRSAVMATLAARGNQPERILPKDWEELKELEHVYGDRFPSREVESRFEQYGEWISTPCGSHGHELF